MSDQPVLTSTTTNTAPLPSGGAGAPLRLGNREVVTDHYFHDSVEAEPTRYQNKVFVRLGARRGTTFRKVSFTHCVFDACYLNHCTFDSCDFTGCRFVGSSFHQSSFTGCRFWYATFERTQIDDDILIGEAPAEENLRVRFARTLRMNFTQLGDAQAVNRAISLELESTELYLRNSWSPKRSTYYRQKYPGARQALQFLKWAEFRCLDFVWGNGESIVKLLRTIVLVLLAVTVYDVFQTGNAADVRAYLSSFADSPAVFLGVVNKPYPPLALAAVACARYVSLALLTALLVKRFGRR